MPHPTKKASTTIPSPRTKAGSASKSSIKIKPRETVKSSQSNQMKSTISDTENDRQGSPVKRAKRGYVSAPPVEPTSSSVDSSCSNVYPTTESTPAGSTQKDDSVKRTKSRAASPVASQCGVTSIEVVEEKDIVPYEAEPPESPLPSLPNGNSDPNETSAQKKLRRDRWNRMLEAELPFLVAEARTELAMQKILQGAHEMEELLIKAMEERQENSLTMQEEIEAQMDASMRKLREANDRFNRQFRMDQDSDLVDLQQLS
ncbi:hypothetical protein E2P81_ATG02571 [Venturia nashicola]|uniref:Uncharacterized protein n=1 Tax=Venturia nashicola TaxID=86259 RepID=A0A4Z1P8N1_9PEZI|nr:hypothetical protein E6O75_ATG02633 [Venturia nashicola]TLD36789.1 hypothetical protein E2P81_ATG02571 [Venturia nashicola]